MSDNIHNAENKVTFSLLESVKKQFINKSIWTLKFFNADVEQQYIESISYFKAIQKQVTSLLTLLLYIIYVFIDLLILSPEQLAIALPFHASLVLYLTILCIGLFYSQVFRKHVDYLLIFVLFYAALGGLSLLNFNIFIYFSEFYIMIFWLFGSIGFSHFKAVKVSSIVIIYIVFLAFYDVLSYVQFTAHTYLILVAFSLGILTSYLIEYFSRTNFESQSALDNANQALQKLNKVVTASDNALRNINVKLQGAILDKEIALKRLKSIALYDNLTGLPNRNLLQERLENMVGMTKRYKSMSAVCFIDVNDFKEVNDTLGHDAGDTVLKTVSSRIKAIIQEGDSLLRFGGDEFILILMSITSEHDIKTILNEISISINQLIEIDNNKANISLSIGVALCPNDTESFADLISFSDKAMYAAKNSHKENVFYHNLV